MARLPRLSVPGYPHHVIQRGNNRQPVFVDDQDRERLLELLKEQARLWDVAVHGYVLMENHFHWLLTPQTEHGLSKLMQALGRSYVRYFNQRHGRSGTLWEGRYRSTLLDPAQYLLPCMVYLDLNPVRSGLYERPEHWRWSSHRHYVGQDQQGWLTPHPLYWQLGNTPFDREASYGAQVSAGLSRAQTEALTRTVLTGWVLGEAPFIHSLQRTTSRRMQPASPGRPPKKTHPSIA